MGRIKELPQRVSDTESERALHINIKNSQAGGRKAWKALALVSVVAAGVVGYVAGQDKEPTHQTVVPLEPTKVKEFVPGGMRCFGLTAQRVSAEISRDNKLPLPLLPDINTPDDRYRISAVDLAELCIKGASDLGNTGSVTSKTAVDGTITVTVDQSKGALFLNRPAIDAKNCTPQEERDMNLQGGRNCLIFVGEDAGWTDFTEIFPGVDDKDYMKTDLLAYTQLQGEDPSCIQTALAKGPDMAALLYATFRQEAIEQDIDPAQIRVSLLGADGQATSAWDSSYQQAGYEASKAEYEARASRNSTIGFKQECDVSGWGIATELHASVPVEQVPDQAV